MTPELERKIKSLPLTPGVYLFKNSKGKVIYVGKAKNLKSRVTSYLALDLGTKTAQMVELASGLETIKVDSEVEALLLEAELVRQYKPKYNIQLKDDKTPIYIGITKEEYPRIILLRRTQLDTLKLKKLYGPFLSSLTAKRILRRIRKVFPFSHHKLGKRACIYSQIGLCNPCPNMINSTADKAQKTKLRKIYLNHISKIEKTLSGKIKVVRRELEAEMKRASKNENYELAKAAKEQIRDMDYFTSSFDRTEGYIENPNLLMDIRERELADLSNSIKKYVEHTKLRRIECFDIAHLAGTYPTASMVVLVDGEIDKRSYRHFRITGRKKADDVDNMKSVLERRKNHFADWGEPDLIIVDGGKTQLSVAKEVLGNDFPVIGLAKRYETLVFKSDTGFSEVRLGNTPAKNLVQRIRDEAHRFARAYHHKLVAKALTKSVS